MSNDVQVHFVIESRNAQNRWFTVATLPTSSSAEAYLAKVRKAMPSTYRLVQVETVRRIVTPLEV